MKKSSLVLILIFILAIIIAIWGVFYFQREAQAPASGPDSEISVFPNLPSPVTIENATKLNGGSYEYVNEDFGIKFKADDLENVEMIINDNYLTVQRMKQKPELSISMTAHKSNESLENFVDKNWNDSQTAIELLEQKSLKNSVGTDYMEAVIKSGDIIIQDPENPNYYEGSKYYFTTPNDNYNYDFLSFFNTGKTSRQILDTLEFIK